MANERARYLRRNQTDTERELWRHPRSLRASGYHFRRQVPVDGYIDAHLEAQGFRVPGFWHNEVMDNLEGVAHMIDRALKASHDPIPSTP